MKLTSLAISMGIGAAAGAVAIMMMPRNNPTRKLAAKAANADLGRVNRETVLAAPQGASRTGTLSCPGPGVSDGREGSPGLGWHLSGCR